MHEEEKLLIELADIQIDHEDLTSSTSGQLAIKFGVIIGLLTIYYEVFGLPSHVLVQSALTIVMFFMLFIIFRTVNRYTERRKEIKQRIEKLKKEYFW